MKRNVPVAATFLTFCAFAFLCSLGVWQLHRLEWKENLLSQIAAVRAAGPQDVRFQEISDSDVPRYVRLRGRYADDAFMVGPRTYEGQNGFHLLVPLIMEGGGMVMVNRGWVPQGEEKNIVSPSGIVLISGMLRRPDRANPFVPANDPSQGRWFFIDPLQMAEAAGFDHGASSVLYVENEDHEGVGPRPVRAVLQWSPPNNHRQYAIFWFSMAVVLLVIYYLRFWRYQR